MKQLALKQLKSVKDFEKAVNRTELFVTSIQSAIVATSEVLKFFHAKEKPEFSKFKHLVITPSKNSYLFELGFVALFANFEFFMTDLLKELFLMYPVSFKDEKSISFDEIRTFKSTDEIKNYFADAYAIEKSNSIKGWADLLEGKFGLKIFNTTNELDGIQMFGLLRNIFMHGGGKTNARFRNDMKKFLNVDIPLNEKVKLNRLMLFGTLDSALRGIIKGFEGKTIVLRVLE